MNKDMTTKEALDELGISDSTLRRWVRSGVIRPVKGTGGQGKSFAFSRAEVLRMKLKDQPSQYWFDLLGRVCEGALLNQEKEYPGAAYGIQNNLGYIEKLLESDSPASFYMQSSTLPAIDDIRDSIKTYIEKTMKARLGVMEIKYLIASLIAQDRRKIPPAIVSSKELFDKAFRLQQTIAANVRDSITTPKLIKYPGCKAAIANHSYHGEYQLKIGLIDEAIKREKKYKIDGQGIIFVKDKMRFNISNADMIFLRRYRKYQRILAGQKDNSSIPSLNQIALLLGLYRQQVSRLRQAVDDKLNNKRL